MEGFTDDTADDDDESGGIHYKQKHMDRFNGRAVQANRVHETRPISDVARTSVGSRSRSMTLAEIIQMKPSA